MSVDYLMRRGRYHRASLTAQTGGLYWRDGGFNWKALVALAAGMFAAMMWIDAQFYFPSYNGPISSATGGADLSWLLGGVVAGLLYWLLSRTSIRKEVADAEAAEASEAAKVTS